MVPRSLIMPSLIRVFSPLPYKKQSGKGTSSLSWNWPSTAHLVEDVGPTHLFSCPFLLCKFPPMKPVRFHGIHCQPYRMTGDEHGRTQLTRQSIPASLTVWGTALNLPVKNSVKFLVLVGSSWQREWGMLPEVCSPSLLRGAEAAPRHSRLLLQHLSVYLKRPSTVDSGDVCCICSFVELIRAVLKIKKDNDLKKDEALSN